MRCMSVSLAFEGVDFLAVHRLYGLGIFVTFCILYVAMHIVEFQDHSVEYFTCLGVDGI